MGKKCTKEFEKARQRICYKIQFESSGSKKIGVPCGDKCNFSFTVKINRLVIILVYLISKIKQKHAKALENEIGSCLYQYIKSKENEGKTLFYTMIIVEVKTKINLLYQF